MIFTIYHNVFNVNQKILTQDQHRDTINVSNIKGVVNMGIIRNWKEMKRQEKLVQANINLLAAITKLDRIDDEQIIKAMKQQIHLNNKELKGVIGNG